MSNFLPQEQNEIIDSWKLKENPSEFVWIKFREKEGYIYTTRKVMLKAFIPEKDYTSARTLEELLALLPIDFTVEFILDFLKNVWAIVAKDENKVIYNSDPKQAVFQMLEWCRENDYLEVVK